MSHFDAVYADNELLLVPKRSACIYKSVPIGKCIGTNASHLSLSRSTVKHAPGGQGCLGRMEKKQRYRKKGSSKTNLY